MGKTAWNTLWKIDFAVSEWNFLFSPRSNLYREVFQRKTIFLSQYLRRLHTPSLNRILSYDAEIYRFRVLFYF